MSCAASQPRACCVVTSPAGRGLVLVRSTFLSRSWSQRSLMVQPAPRRRIAPRPKSDRVGRSGKWPGAAARLMDQKHGHARSHVPIGLSRRDSWA